MLGVTEKRRQRLIRRFPGFPASFRSYRIVIVILSGGMLLACGGKVKRAEVTQIKLGIASPAATVKSRPAVHLTPIPALSFLVSPTASPEPTVATAVPRRRRLENREVGYSLLYPDNWQVKRNVVATEFATGATCESVVVVDFQPPPESGPAAFILHSFVQICSKSLADKSTLEEFMRQTYGDAFFTRFQITNLAGVAAYQLASQGSSTTIFLQTNRHRIQIVTAVVASPDKQAQRVVEVQEILDSLSFF